MKKEILVSFLVIVLIGGCKNKLSVEEPNLQKVAYDYKPNILWISCEDISPYLSIYGDSTISTPNLDRLAAEGIQFNNVFATTGQCAPSRHSIITGMHSTCTSGSNMRTGGKQFPDSIRCFPLYLEDLGYYCTNNFKTDYNFSDPPHASLWNESSRTAHWKNKPSGAPFFAVFNRHETHESHILQHKPLRVDPEKVPVPPYYPDVASVRRDIARNYSNIIELDSIIGDYLTELEDAGLMDSTIIVFWSDHGGPLPRQKREIVESGTRVPMLVRLPNKQFAGIKVDDMVSLIDLGPSMLSLVGIPTPHNMHGRAFIGKYKTEPQEYVYGGRDRQAGVLETMRYVQGKKYLYLHNYYPELPWWSRVEYRQAKSRMMEDILRLRDEGELNEEQMRWFAKSKPMEELYDVTNDPHSMNNLATDPNMKSELEKMRQAHLDWMYMTKDVGLFPEDIQASMEKQYGMTMYEIMRTKNIPLEKVRDVALLWTKGEQSIPALVEALDDTLAVNRYHAAIGLGNLNVKDNEITGKLKELLNNDPEKGVTYAAAYAILNSTDDEKTISFIKQEIFNDNPYSESGYILLTMLKRLKGKAKIFEDELARTYDILTKDQVNGYYEQEVSNLLYYLK